MVRPANYIRKKPTEKKQAANTNEQNFKKWTDNAVSRATASYIRKTYRKQSGRPTQKNRT